MRNEQKYTSERAVAYVSAFSWPETVKNAGFPKKSWQVEKVFNLWISHQSCSRQSVSKRSENHKRMQTEWISGIIPFIFLIYVEWREGVAYIMQTRVRLTCDQSITPSFVFGMSSSEERAASGELGICLIVQKLYSTQAWLKSKIQN